MSIIILSVFVPGTPVGQGSMRPITMGGKTVLIHAKGDRFAVWRNSLIDRFAAEIAPDALFFPTAAPVAADAVFSFARPKGHFGRGRNADVVKDSAPAWPMKGNDLDKQIRTVGDALQIAGVIADDSQIVAWTAAKRFGPPGARITLRYAPAAIPAQAPIPAIEDTLRLEAG